MVRTLVKALLLTRITYGLPFFTWSKQQCARLDSLLFRPLLTALALPTSVNRASLAVYFFTVLSSTIIFSEISLSAMPMAWNATMALRWKGER